MVDLIQAARNIQKFENGSLTNTIASIEELLAGKSKRMCTSSTSKLGVDSTLLASAFTLKSAAGQVNVLIHAVGILSAIPDILEDNEIVESFSLGAGNTGKSFDLETNLRIAEFKFIQWKGADSIRQNSLFKDFFYLAEEETSKKRCLYITSKELPLKFLNGNRAIDSVVSTNKKLSSDFSSLYGERFKRVSEYYRYREDRVKLIDIIKLVPHFAECMAAVE